MLTETKFKIDGPDIAQSSCKLEHLSADQRKVLWETFRHQGFLMVSLRPAEYGFAMEALSHGLSVTPGWE